jgi:sterol desaturase/sphingolipid hydroxylase (fatty acid hydroxylase superfamily)
LGSFAISHDIAAGLALLLLISFWIGLIQMNKKRKKVAKENGKKWLLNEIIYGYSSLAGMSYLPIQIFFNFENNSSQMMLFFMSVFIVSIVIIEYIIFFIIPSKAQDYLEKTYPEYQLSNQ